MKKVVMLLLLVGLTEMGAIQAMGNSAAEEAKSAGYSVYSGSAGNYKELLTSGTSYADSYGNPGAVFSRISSRQPSLEDIRKTLKGYRSINRKTYPIQLMELA